MSIGPGKVVASRFSCRAECIEKFSHYKVMEESHSRQKPRRLHLKDIVIKKETHFFTI
jgi:hypothetical protein